MARKGAPGDIVRIDFDGGLHTYGQILAVPYVAVYDLPTADDVTDMADVVSQPILFIVAVYDRALGPKGWPVVGKAPDGSPDVPVPEYFMQDRFNPQNCKIIDVDGNMRRVAPHECEGLERAAVWEAEHIAERLRDHYAGRSNVHLESMKLRR